MSPLIRIDDKAELRGFADTCLSDQSGAPADVFASAAEKNLRDIAYDKSSYRVFVLNRLGNSGRKGLPGIRSVADLSRVKMLVGSRSGRTGRQLHGILFAKASKIYGIKVAGFGSVSHRLSRGSTSSRCSPRSGLGRRMRGSFTSAT